jgi:phosphatidate cytidylyltransferase
MKRILTAVILIAVVFALIFFGQLWMISLFALLIAELAAFEYLQLARTGGANIPILWMLPATACLFLPLIPAWPLDAQLPLLSLLAMALFAWNGFRAPLARVLPDTSQGLFGLLYIAFPLTLLPAIWKLEDGPTLLLFLMVTVWSGDIAALYIGRAFGKHKLAPRLSPGKTWEGSIASVLGSLLAGLSVVLASDHLAARGSISMHITQPLWQSILLAILLNVAAQVGDLLESAIKRGAGVKDSGTMLPGHGGILDRIDALLLAAPVLWYALLLKDTFKLGAF